MSTSAAINATTLGCSITCKDLETSIRFYRDAIGFAVAQTYERDGKVATAAIAAGDIRIVLNQDDGKLGWDRVKGPGLLPADQRGHASRRRRGRRAHQGRRRPWPFVW